MKKNLILFGSIVLIGGGFPTLGLADTLGTASIDFIEDSGTTSPKDPNDPSKDSASPSFPDEEGNKETGGLGPLSLDVVPGNMNFGTQVLDYKGGVYNGIPSSSSESKGLHFIQLTDNRGLANGWQVTVKRTEFSDGNKTIDGSRLLIPMGVARNSLSDTPTAADQNIVINSISTENDPFKGMYEIGLTSSTLLSVGAPTESNPVIGKGTTVYSWEVGNEKLSIPAGFGAIGNYSSTINWTLSAGVSS